jgi:hypothetical protein
MYGENRYICSEFNLGENGKKVMILSVQFFIFQEGKWDKMFTSFGNIRIYTHICMHMCVYIVQRNIHIKM